MAVGQSSREWLIKRYWLDGRTPIDLEIKMKVTSHDNTIFSLPCIEAQLIYNSVIYNHYFKLEDNFALV